MAGRLLPLRQRAKFPKLCREQPDLTSGGHSRYAPRQPRACTDAVHPREKLHGECSGSTEGSQPAFDVRKLMSEFDPSKLMGEFQNMKQYKQPGVDVE
jgi:hypothetical protein